MPTDKTCFVIAPIGETDTAIRKRSDQVLKHIIKPAAEECGFTPLRADGISLPGLITSQVIQHILDAPMVVADLTGRNANVYYELAIRHAIRRPYVQIIDQTEPLPFDVSGVRTIQFNLHDLDSVENTRTEIVKQMKSMTGANGKVESPITAAVDLSTLAKSNNPADRHFGEVLTAIAELKQQITTLQRQVPTTKSPDITDSSDLRRRYTVISTREKTLASYLEKLQTASPKDRAAITSAQQALAEIHSERIAIETLLAAS